MAISLPEIAISPRRAQADELRTWYEVSACVGRMVATLEETDRAEVMEAMRSRHEADSIALAETSARLAARVDERSAAESGRVDQKLGELQVKHA